MATNNRVVIIFGTGDRSREFGVYYDTNTGFPATEIGHGELPRDPVTREDLEGMIPLPVLVGAAGLTWADAHVENLAGPYPVAAIGRCVRWTWHRSWKSGKVTIC